MKNTKVLKKSLGFLCLGGAIATLALGVLGICDYFGNDYRKIAHADISRDNREQCQHFYDDCVHGPGREAGYSDNFLTAGCRNYASNGFNYGTGNSNQILKVPYYINKSGMNDSLISKIVQQANMWNEAVMYDGTGQIVNLYKVDSTIEIDKLPIPEVSISSNLTVNEDTVAGKFEYNEHATHIYLDPSKMNEDTPLHEFGHLLGLTDLEGSGTGIKRDTHKVLMGYERGTTEATVCNAIKYQDIQGIAVMNNRHTQHSYYRYVKNSAGQYLHFCFYCDMVESYSFALSGSSHMAYASSCNHTYDLMVSHGNRFWSKCTKCYKVIETDKSHLPVIQNVTPDEFFTKGSNGYYQIKTEEDLRLMRVLTVNHQSYGQHIPYSYELVNDITLTEPWTPVPTEYRGNFKGNGRTIWDMNIHVTKNDLSSEYFGFFRYTINSSISNVKFENCNITTDKVSNDDMTYYGILAGCSQGGSITRVTISNCNITCEVSNSVVGAMAGVMISSSCYDESSISGGVYESSGFAMGGMTGWSISSAIYNCKCKTTLNVNSTDHFGKVIGYREDGGSLEGRDCDVNVKINKPCVAIGTLITLADGRQVPVETLTGDEMLLVWNLKTGSFDTAPILFIDSDPWQSYKVIDLSFSDGTSVKVIYEHGFWDYDLNEYVYLRNDAEKYIGHWFDKQGTDENGNFVSQRVQLTGVTVKYEYTKPYSPVTYGHLCYYVNGMLSMPGGIEGLFNVFEVDAKTMRYDEEKMQADIEQYGLFTYEEFAELVPVSEEVFEAFNGEYLKVAIGKGLIDCETLNRLAIRYAEYLT